MTGSAQRKRSGGQAILGALDQALLAAAHFVLGVLVARLGGVAALGQFAFAYSLIVLINMVHAAVVAEIYSVDPQVPEGVRRYGASPLGLLTLALGLGGAGLLGLVGVWSEQIRAATWSPAFLCALISSTCYWSVKPFFYRQQRPFAVLAITIAYALALLVSAGLGYHVWGAAWQPLWSIAIGATLASMPLWYAMRRPDPQCAAHMQRYLRATLKYASWALPAALLIWVNSNGYMFLMPLYGDTVQTGGLRAVLNLVAPINTLVVGACTAMLPILAELHRGGDAARYARTVHRTAIGLFVLTLGGAAVIAPFSGWLIALIYGEPYRGFADALQVAALLPALWVTASIYRSAIRAQANTRDLFKVYAMALLPVGLILMAVLGRYGAAAAVKGMLVTQLLVVMGFVYHFYRRTSPRWASA
jgi:O-antigen/teichoic acid export membrane protein